MRRACLFVLILWLLVVATPALAADAPKNASTTPAPSSTAASTTPKPKEKEKDKPSPLQDIEAAFGAKSLGCIEAFKDIVEGVDTFFKNLLDDFF